MRPLTRLWQLRSPRAARGRTGDRPGWRRSVAGSYAAWRAPGVARASRAGLRICFLPKAPQRHFGNKVDQLELIDPVQQLALLRRRWPAQTTRANRESGNQRGMAAMASSLQAHPPFLPSAASWWARSR